MVLPLVDVILSMFLYELQESAKAEVDKIMLTDASLLFPPGQVYFMLS